MKQTAKTLKLRKARNVVHLACARPLVKVSALFYDCARTGLIQLRDVRVWAGSPPVNAKLCPSYLSYCKCPKTPQFPLPGTAAERCS